MNLGNWKQQQQQHEKQTKTFFIHILASTAPGKLEGYGKNTSSGCVLKDHKKVLSAHKNVKYSLTSLPLLSSAAPHLSSTLPVRTGSGNTRRKSFPGLESAGEIRAVQAHQRASGTISRWENRRALSLAAHVGKRNRGHAGLCAADLHARRTGLDIENVPRGQKKNAEK